MMEENILKKNFYVLVYGGMLLAYSFLIIGVFSKPNGTNPLRSNHYETPASSYQIPVFEPFNTEASKKAESKKKKQLAIDNNNYADFLMPNSVKFQTPKLRYF